VLIGVAIQRQSMLASVDKQMDSQIFLLLRTAGRKAHQPANSFPSPRRWSSPRA
jgi:hypothetical protein